VVGPAAFRRDQPGDPGTVPDVVGHRLVVLCRAVDAQSGQYPTGQVGVVGLHAAVDDGDDHPTTLGDLVGGGDPQRGQVPLFGPYRFGGLGR
jgi:hypothetical protein